MDEQSPSPALNFPAPTSRRGTDHPGDPRRTMSSPATPISLVRHRSQLAREKTATPTAAAARAEQPLLPHVRPLNRDRVKRPPPHLRPKCHEGPDHFSGRAEAARWAETRTAGASQSIGKRRPFAVRTSACPLPRSRTCPRPRGCGRCPRRRRGRRCAHRRGRAGPG